MFDECIKLDGEIDLKEKRMQYIYGHGIEEADQILEPGSFDFIVSRAVMHNVYDIERGFEAMDRVLAPGGYMAAQDRSSATKTCSAAAACTRSLFSQSPNASIT